MFFAILLDFFSVLIYTEIRFGKFYGRKKTIYATSTTSSLKKAGDGKSKFLFASNSGAGFFSSTKPSFSAAAFPSFG